ncbi:hypothetical protein BD779DRAFT_1488011 [Infundibulicybe gibba]|nr:hypothetical protein BD779DRAFT_1488011 [Infundibulicybe gibba]
MPASLLDLPNEVLIQILGFDNLNNELYSLALLSKRLNQSSLPIFFANHGLTYTDPNALCRIPLDGSLVDVLSGLLIYPPVPARRFFVDITARNLFRQLERLQRFFSRQPSISEVVLFFGPLEKYTSGKDNLLLKWVAIFGDLINTIVSKSCGSIRIAGSHHMTSAYTFFPHRSGLRRVVQAVSRGFGNRPPLTMCGRDWEFRRDRKQGSQAPVIQLSPQASRAASVTAFYICSPILLLPPCSPWTLSVIQASSITSLTFSVELPADVAAAVLPLVFAAAINITRLTVIECMWDMGKISLPNLPNLYSLRADPGFIIHVIQTMNTPQLRSICMHHSAKQRNFHILELSHILTILDTLRLTPAVSLDVAFAALRVAPGVQLINPTEGNHPLMQVVELVIDPALIYNINIPIACAWLQNFPRITRLVMDQLAYYKPHVKAGHLELLLDAIAHTHPCLRVVEILDQHHEVPRVNEVSKGRYVFEQSRATRWESNVPFTAKHAGIPRSFPRVMPESVNRGM